MARSEVIVTSAWVQVSVRKMVLTVVDFPTATEGGNGLLMVNDIASEVGAMTLNRSNLGAQIKQGEQKETWVRSDVVGIMLNLDESNA